MRQALLLTAALTAAFMLIDEALDFRFAAALGFGATAVIAVINALTFLWLWQTRATPLALGMAFTWFGQASLTSWWYLAAPPGPEWLNGNVLVFLLLSLYIVGGALHIAVMHRSMALSRGVLVWPVLAVFGIAVLVNSLS